jgi:hypothetical protein
MNYKNIFQRNPADEDEVPVPKIEVGGDKVRIPGNQGPEEPGPWEEDPSEQHRKTREFRLPKTTWFHDRRKSVTHSKAHYPVALFAGRENGR